MFRGADRSEVGCSAPGPLTSVPRLDRAPPRAPHAAVRVLLPGPGGRPMVCTSPLHRAGVGRLGWTADRRRKRGKGRCLWWLLHFNSEKRS